MRGEADCLHQNSGILRDPYSVPKEPNLKIRLITASPFIKHLPAAPAQTWDRDLQLCFMEILPLQAVLPRQCNWHFACSWETVLLGSNIGAPHCCGSPYSRGLMSGSPISENCKAHRLRNDAKQCTRSPFDPFYESRRQAS